MNPSGRWPLHPRPGPIESLSSWLARIARPYELPVKDLLTHNLGLAGLTIPADLDDDPPAVMLAALAERTGVELARLKTMTMAGWVPWIFGAVETTQSDDQEIFDTYVRENSVLLAPGEAGSNVVSRKRIWRGPWRPVRPLGRLCPLCAADPDRGEALVWRLPLMIGCIEHGCRLEDASAVPLSPAGAGEGRQPAPVEEPVATLDRYTYQGLTTGQVALPGRTVHAGVWFRLLRALLDEVSLALTTLSITARSALERIWRATGRPARGGLAAWRPYEHLGWEVQETLLHAAATALQMAADGQIVARGVLASALSPVPHRAVYDGDRPPPDPVRDLMESIGHAIQLARRDREAARNLLLTFAAFGRSEEWYRRLRADLTDCGVPEGFLPPSLDECRHPASEVGAGASHK